MIKLRNAIISFFYKNLLRKILFRIDPEKIHDRAIYLGRILGSNLLLKKITSLFLNFSDPSLKQNIAGIPFINPIGLAAGFDKNAQLIEIMPKVGFGFMEVGSFTGQPCAGNPKPRLWRLVKSRGLVVNYGLKNDGAEAISQRLANQSSQIPLGINIGKTNSAETVELEKGINDYLKGIQSFLDIGDYLTINISCPNACGGESFTEPNSLNLLLKQVDRFDIKKPIFLKMAPNLPWQQIDQIIELAHQYQITGFICSNLSKNRNNSKVLPQEISKLPQDVGSVSGKPAEQSANGQIKYIYQKTKGQKVIMGCGGVFSAEDAYKKIRLGANLIQLITGMIFEGPQVISQINLGLSQLLKRDRFENISQAVGIDNK
tara:strand:- start:3782 stop:4903 length:1122 start_codon:yes stop_codon:yes gene_type:complete